MRRIRVLAPTLPVVIISMLVASAVLGQTAVNITANQIGRLTSVGNGATRTYNQYDALGRTVATQYEQDGRSTIFTAVHGYAQGTGVAGPGDVIVREIFPDGEEAAATYDASGMKVMIRSRRGAVIEDVLLDYRLNARGQVTKIRLGNGTETTYTYDETGDLRVKRATTVNSRGELIQDYGYAYDGVGNVIETTDFVRDGNVPDQSFKLEYDSLGQLTAMLTPAGAPIERYVYDALGNLKQKDAILQNYGAGGRPHALADSASVPYQYDANGNVTSIGSATTIGWNAENMPIKVTSGSTVAEKSFVGAGLWKKVEQGVTTYYFYFVTLIADGSIEPKLLV